MKIYLADDEPIALAYIENELRLALDQLNITAEIKTFKNSSALLVSAESSAPDIVFLDIEMPGMNGLVLAKELKRLKNNINIIFATSYDNYALDALNLYASGYIMKPADKNDIIKALMNLRFSVSDTNVVRIRTFGNFDVFVNDVPMKFRSQKSKELLAYLVDRQGASITTKEAAAVLYENDDYSRYIQKSLCRIANYLTEDLRIAGVPNIFINGDGIYSVDLNNIYCDLYEYFNNNGVNVNGEYMEQYSWGEYRKSFLL